MKRLKNSASEAGYDQEELYFFKRDQELKNQLKGRPKLTLLQGGKSTSSSAVAQPEKTQSEDPPEKTKKAA